MILLFKNILHILHSKVQLKCTLNDIGQGCMQKPGSCSQLKSKVNCGEKAIISDEDQCLPSECGNLKLEIYNLENCYMKSFKKFTVDSEKNVNIKQQKNCSEYQSMDSCQINNQSKKCIIRFDTINSKYLCDQEKCEDLFISNYNTFLACQNYNKTCTVISRVNCKGCLNREEDCFNYKTFEQCIKKLKGKKCLWNSNKCLDYDNF
ncbi:unnamed protein product [Paramecium sonneborni]|uniref:Uncharacterized protein n=1 Tax=Paramecium sonneborni TaxID=65129 RepID=A0A8S1RV23_9CILI|nr:unnamed protein product [Paramecium sonneborni]